MCSPCHAPQVSLVFGVATTPFGWFASGVERPPAQAAVWRSVDQGATWQRVAGIPLLDSSIGLSIASNDGRVVIVGRSSSGGAAWVTTDGEHWTASSDPALEGPAGGTGMNSVVPWQTGFVAVGVNDDPANNTTVGAVWTSNDGLAWQHVAIGDTALAGAHVLGVAAGPSSLVAVGTTDSETRGTGVSWVSRDGRSWTRSTSGLESGIPRAVTPTDDGFIAVGLRSDDAGAMVWRSSDGATWTSVADQPSFHAGTSPARLMTVVTTPSEIVAAGWRADTAFGEAFVLRSADGGDTFVADPTDNSFYGAEINRLAVTPDGIAAVGVVGYPDNDQGEAWNQVPATP
jgi:hypothetical protein